MGSGAAKCGPLPARSGSIAAEAVDETAVAFGWTRGGRGLEEEPGLALFREQGAGCAALICFAIEGLCGRSGTANLTEREDIDFKKAAFSLDREAVPGANFAGRAQGLMVRLDAIQLAGFGGEGAGFEEARGPEPFVETHEASVNPGSGKAGS